MTDYNTMKVGDLHSRPAPAPPESNQAARKRIERRKSYIGKTPEQILKDTPLKMVRKWANSGAPLAQAELKRREAPQPPAATPVMSQLFRQPTTLQTRADILAERRHGSPAAIV